jgi:uncharacterized protein YabE (DUF348 family)/3D (Asp-Asp-Asp) domain-containing protein
MSPEAQTPEAPPTDLISILQRFNRRWFILLLAGGGLVIACAAVCVSSLTLALFIPSKPVSVTVIVSGTGQQVQTSSQTVADLLEEYGLTLNPGDTVEPPPESRITPKMVIRLVRARAVSLTVDGDSQTLQTQFTNPLDILNSAGLSLGPKDRVMVDGTQATAAELLVWPVPVNNLTIQRAMPVKIDDGGAHISIETTAQTVGEALFEAGVTLYLADVVTPDLSAPVSKEMTVTIQRSQPISIVADGVTLETRVQGQSVQEALAGAGVMLVGLDYSIPSEESPLQPGMSIRVIRVMEQVEQKQAVIPFETIYQPDATLELDQERVVQEGQNGVLQTNTRIRYENGVEVSRADESSTVAREALNRIMAYGTNIVLRTIDTPDGPKEYWRVLRMYATSYHPAALGGDDVTATGRKLTKGVVGIDPKVIPYGSQLYVPGYGVGVAGDTGGPRKFKLWIDLGYDDSNWVSWSKYIDVYLLTPVPPDVRYVLPE